MSEQIHNPRQARFSDAPWFKVGESPKVLVGGAGGIGSWLTILLVRAGFSPYVYDFDLLEEHNLAGQAYFQSNLNEYKIQALQEVVLALTGDSFIGRTEKITEQTTPMKLCFSAFDNMEARQTLFNRWANRYGEDPEAIFIDGRLQAEQLQVFCIRGGDAENIHNYLSKQLFSDSEVAETSCTFKQTSHVAAMIASFMTSFFTNHIANLNEGNTERKVPYYFEYFIPMNYVGKNPD